MKPDASDDALGVRALGHRGFIGGDGAYWDLIADLQFDFLCSRGLRPHHVLLDFACGSMRGGSRFIPYLDPGHYLGFDKSMDLVVLGVAEELGTAVFRDRRPQLVVNGQFDLSAFAKTPDFVIAQSIFTHLDPDDVVRALRAIAAIATQKTELFATYFDEMPSGYANPERSHSRLVFFYSPEEMGEMARAGGWRFEHLGDWNHPRGQVMGRMTIASET